MTQEEIDELKEEFSEIKHAISAARKNGADMFIPQLKLINIPSKIKMAEATQEGKDIAKVRSLLAEVKQELPAELSKESFKNISGAFEQVNSYITQAQEAISAGNKAESKRLYQEICKRFAALTKDQKSEVLGACKQIIKELQ